MRLQCTLFCFLKLANEVMLMFSVVSDCLFTGVGGGG